MSLVRRADGDAASYLEIAEAIQLQGDAEHIESDPAQLYRRVASAILVTNRGDHLRNHGVLRGKTDWRLASAFDRLAGTRLE